MERSRGPFLLVAVALAVAISACATADQDAADQRRHLALKACEDAVLDQLSSRATAKFVTDSEHVYYDSTGAAVAGTVSTTVGQRNFACLLKLASDSTWTLSQARLLN